MKFRETIQSKFGHIKIGGIFRVGDIRNCICNEGYKMIVRLDRGDTNIWYVNILDCPDCHNKIGQRLGYYKYRIE